MLTARCNNAIKSPVRVQIACQPSDLSEASPRSLLVPLLPAVFMLLSGGGSDQELINLQLERTRGHRDVRLVHRQNPTAPEAGSPAGAKGKPAVLGRLNARKPGTGPALEASFHHVGLPQWQDACTEVHRRFLYFLCHTYTDTFLRPPNNFGSDVSCPAEHPCVSNTSDLVKSYRIRSRGRCRKCKLGTWASCRSPASSCLVAVGHAFAYQPLRAGHSRIFRKGNSRIGRPPRTIDAGDSCRKASQKTRRSGADLHGKRLKA